MQCPAAIAYLEVVNVVDVQWTHKTELATLGTPPLRLPGSLVAVRTKGKQLLETADKWESWSEDVFIII
ncbi:hypothetical protein OG21DRAFT_1514323 [Imleria badia]|nr:hypothetical protein OG21DRAFT_1514323 [Imleria badia]